jgi:hypothetical protein
LVGMGENKRQKHKVCLDDSVLHIWWTNDRRGSPWFKAYIALTNFCLPAKLGTVSWSEVETLDFGWSKTGHSWRWSCFSNEADTKKLKNNYLKNTSYGKS